MVSVAWKGRQEQRRAGLLRGSGRVELKDGRSLLVQNTVVNVDDGVARICRVLLCAIVGWTVNGERTLNGDEFEDRRSDGSKLKFLPRNLSMDCSFLVSFSCS